MTLPAALVIVIRSARLLTVPLPPGNHFLTRSMMGEEQQPSGTEEGVFALSSAGSRTMLKNESNSSSTTPRAREVSFTRKTEVLSVEESFSTPKKNTSTRAPNKGKERAKRREGPVVVAVVVVGNWAR